eukprot:scaffold3287_cov181-Amphora_coffeaeformis.AAC.7
MKVPSPQQPQPPRPSFSFLGPPPPPTTTTTTTTTRTAVKLMLTGASVGTVVDSLHNQILLEYHVAPIRVVAPSSFASSEAGTVSGIVSPLSLSLHDGSGVWLASSWIVPPLLAVAYLLLGAVLPRIVQKIISSVSNVKTENLSPANGKDDKNNNNNTKIRLDTRGVAADTTITTTAMKDDGANNLSSSSSSLNFLRDRALWAVTTTAMIVKLSDVLERHPEFTLPLPEFVPITTTTTTTTTLAWLDVQHLIILFAAAILQWWTLDRTVPAFVLAALAAYGGPLGE